MNPELEQVLYQLMMLFVPILVITFFYKLIQFIYDYKYYGGYSRRHVSKFLRDNSIYLSTLVKNPKISSRKLNAIKRNIIQFRYPTYGIRITKKKFDSIVASCVMVEENDQDDLRLIGHIKYFAKIDPDRDIDTYMELVWWTAMSHQARLAKNRRECKFYEKKAISKIIEQRLKIEKHQIIEKEKLAAEEAAAAALEQNEALTMLQRIADNTEEPDTVPVEPVEPSGTAIREAPKVGLYELYPQVSSQKIGDEHNG